ncbi:MAG TPA: serine hydrolase domain-containing protein, partial [Vicinamibacterales bacterium]|nr:serine hydrolase domain-containing protein [Vicinamibacterales bacterium]
MKPFGPKMPVFAVTAVAIVICLAATTDGQGQTSPTQRPSPARSAEAAVDQLFAQWNNSTSPGCSLGITRNGALVYERGHGMANLDLGAALTPASVFNVASVSKQFTAMAVLLLAKGGHLSLDDEVRKYIPELPDYGTRLTIRHLLTHTSGLRNAFGLRGLAAPRDDGTDENDEIVMMLARQRALDFTPGTRYTYNNGAYIMLGVLVKRVSGQSLRAFAEANIFKPLGMAHTHFHDDVGEIVPNRASGYTRGPGGLRVTNPADEGGFVGNAGLFTTVRDLLIWEQNFSVVRVGDPALVAAMQAPTTLTGGGISSYGFGLELGEYRGLRTVGHTGDEPGWVAHVVRFPSQEFTVALLCNFDAPAVTTLTRRIADIHLGDALTDLVTSPSEVATLTGPPVALAADDLAADVGFYRDASTEGLLR